MYIRGMFETLAYEWDNLDVWRQDKFMMVGGKLRCLCVNLDVLTCVIWYFRSSLQEICSCDVSSQ